MTLAQRVQQQQGDGSAGRAGGINRRGNASVNSVHSATQSLENVERALGDLRLQNVQHVGTTNGSTGTRGNGTRNGGGTNRRVAPTTVQAAPITIPLTEFDFQTANARFKKSSGRKPGVNGANDEGDSDSDTQTNPSDEEEETQSKTSSSKVAKDDKTSNAYNPKSSFFDSLSSNVMEQNMRGGRGGRGNRGGRGMGRSRREEEREKNVATFGEPGGLGLMGPDAYVGGYGGSSRGRRGGRGGRRGAPRRGNVNANSIVQ